MTKMDALNQHTLRRCFRALRDFNTGLYDSKAYADVVENIYEDYMENVISLMEDIMEGTKNE